MSDTGYAPGLRLPEVCPSVRHNLFGRLDDAEWDPDCQTCMARKITRGDHDHLHLNGEKCLVPGLKGIPGSFVKCKCGGYHH